MASMRDIKRRKWSIQSTQQITKAMKLVSTVKLQKAKTKAEESKPYFDTMYQTVRSILSMSENISHPYLDGGAGSKKGVIVITSNRGLAGGYNSNITKLITKGDFSKEDLEIYAVGKRGRDTLERNGFHIAADYSEVMEEPSYHDAMHIGRRVLEAFEKGEIGEIYLAYTIFKNTVVHIPVLVKLLPVCTDDFAGEQYCRGSLSGDDAGQPEEQQGPTAPMNFEMEEVDALDLLIPKYITSMIYGGLLEASASENGARMQAMDSATSNAEDIIEDLTLLYNRARQGSITQELTEIIAGAQAIS
ncbi:ATP synthase F1 subunit gamma [Eisenbergiella sp.]